jgi:hypothetical protein
MKTSHNTSASVLRSALVAAVWFAAVTVPAASLVLTSDQPTPGTFDVYNFLGADSDTANINGGADQQTYVAYDRPTQGQTFTTPAGSGTFLITDIWIRHAGYTNVAPGNGTWWNLANGAQYTVRVTDPSSNGTPGFVVTSESYTATGTENAGAQWTGGNNSLGDDVWLHFTLVTPVALTPGKKYGIDLTASVQGGGNYLEWLGVNSDVLSGGEAYTGTAAHTPGTTVTTNVGDRVFLVQLGHTVPAVPPQLTSALRFVPAGQSVNVQAIIPTVANSEGPATLVLTNNNPGVISLPGGASTLTLDFATGATNRQDFAVQVLTEGVGVISVVPNSSFTEASISVGTPILASESFEYDSATEPYLEQANRGIGFSGPWSQPTFGDVIVSGLTYGSNPSFVTSSNAAAVAGVGNEAFRPLEGTYGGVGGGTVYVGFLVQAPGGVSDWGGFSLFQGTTSENLFIGTVLSQSPNDTWGFLQGGNARMNFPGSVAPGPQTDLLICRIDFPTTNGGMAFVSCYVNPPLNSNEPYTPTGSGFVNNFTFDFIRLGTSDSLVFDEIRLGTHWTNVMKFTGPAQPLPPPTPTLSGPARFAPVGKDTPVTVAIPASAPWPLVMTITNDNPDAFSISPTNPALTTLTFGVGSTNVQAFNIHVSGAGTATLSVLSNSTVNTASISFASQVSASESFQYEAGTDNLPGQIGGSGFDINTWTGGGSVISPGMTYPDLVTSSNHARIVGPALGGTGNGSRSFYLSSGDYGGVGGGTVWVGFLIRGAFPETPQTAGVQLGGLFMGLDTYQPNNGKWGFTGPGMGETGFANSVTPSANTDLLVYRLDFPSVAGELVTVTLYANPPAGPNPPAAPTGVASANLFTFNSVSLNTDFSMDFDEVRIGGSWSEVVPTTVVPAPELSVQRSGNQIQIAWPASATGFTLQSSTSLTGTWGPANLTETTQGDQRVATDTTTGDTKFYRLQQQQ